MVIGTGIDIIEVNRIRNAATEHFLKRVFTENEIKYYNSRNNSAETLAGTFAAKEAVSKALCAGFSGISWKDIEIIHDEAGKPYVKLWNAALSRINDIGGSIVHVSISHIKSLAIAQAILE